jgi:hypothetical protein
VGQEITSLGCNAIAAAHWTFTSNIGIVAITVNAQNEDCDRAFMVVIGPQVKVVNKLAH